MSEREAKWRPIKGLAVAEGTACEHTRTDGRRVSAEGLTKMSISLRTHNRNNKHGHAFKPLSSASRQHRLRSLVLLPIMRAESDVDASMRHALPWRERVVPSFLHARKHEE